MDRDDGKGFFVFIVSFVMLVVLFFGFFVMFLCPMWSVWNESKRGEGEIARAEFNRKIATLEAQEKMESAKFLADAEVIRAEGVAKANKIIGDSLKNNDGYLRYLWIQGLQTNQMQVVYVPTEANLPIMESQRLK